MTVMNLDWKLIGVVLGVLSITLLFLLAWADAKRDRKKAKGKLIVVALLVLPTALLVVDYIKSFQGEADSRIQSKQINKVAIDVEVSRKLLEHMAAYDVMHGNALKEKYPLGYAIFTMADGRTAIPYESNLSKALRIDWSVARVHVLDSRVHFRIPTIFRTGETLPIHGEALGFTYVFPTLKPGERVKFLDFARERISGIAEIAEDTRHGLMLILGFRSYHASTPQGQREPPHAPLNPINSPP
jgi:hypothetical protein